MYAEGQLCFTESWGRGNLGILTPSSSLSQQHDGCFSCLFAAPDLCPCWQPEGYHYLDIVGWMEQELEPPNPWYGAESVVTAAPRTPTGQGVLGWLQDPGLGMLRV